MAYVDGFVLSVPSENLTEYKKMASAACKVWMEYGALDYKEAVADDMNANGMVEFPKMAKSKAGEVVIFAFITFKSRAERDKINKKVMKDPRIAAMCPDKNKKPPFDWKRMAYGGFKVIVDGGK